MATTTANSSFWRRVGDAAHVINFLNALLFAFSVVRQPDWFDPEWRKDGFCVSNADKEFWTSHDLCLYVDCALAAVVGVFYLLLRTQPGMESANELVQFNILGVVGHGIGHATIAKAIRDGFVADGERTGWEMAQREPLQNVLSQSIPILVFWVLLLKAAMTKASYPTVFVSAVLASTAALFFPSRLNFTYVQTILFAAFDINEVMRPISEKGFEYGLYPLLLGIPLGVIGWAESTQCSSGIIDLGGHVIYDAYIPISMLIFYLTCWLRTNMVIRGKSVSSKQKSA
jgi:hypothetical protein